MMKNEPTSPPSGSAELRVSVLAEINWEFDDDGPDWSYCQAHATFSHREACEFVLHVGSDGIDASGLPEYARNLVDEMMRWTCTPAFIEAYTSAARTGAARVLFWC